MFKHGKILSIEHAFFQDNIIKTQQLKRNYYGVCDWTFFVEYRIAKIFAKIKPSETKLH